MHPRLKLAAIGAFVIVDVILLVFAVQHLRRTPDPGDLPEVDIASDVPAAAGEQQTFDFDASASVVMDYSNDGTVAYAVRGKCDAKSPTKLFVSTNGGKSFAERETDLTTIVGVDIADDGELTVTGGRAACDAVELVSDDNGETFTDLGEADEWRLGLTELDRVVTPSASTKVGCTVTSMVPVGETFARASCADGTIMGTGDEGETWVKLGRLDNVRVLTFSSFTRGFALARYAGCAAQEFTTDDGGRTWSPGGCIAGDPAQAIAANDLGLGALVGMKFFTSDDRGATFKPA